MGAGNETIFDIGSGLEEIIKAIHGNDSSDNK